MKKIKINDEPICVSLERDVNDFFIIDDEKCEFCEDEEPPKIIGTIQIDDKTIGRFFIYEFYNDENFYDLCDSISGDCEMIAATICGKNGAILKKYLTKDSLFDKIFVLDNIEINKNYRGKGIGTKIVKNLPKMLRMEFDYCPHIILCACDYISADKYGFDSIDYKNGCKKLIEFYKQFGYKLIKNNIMIYNAPEEE